MGKDVIPGLKCPFRKLVFKYGSSGQAVFSFTATVVNVYTGLLIVEASAPTMRCERCGTLYNLSGLQNSCKRFTLLDFGRQLQQTVSINNEKIAAI